MVSTVRVRQRALYKSKTPVNGGFLLPDSILQSTSFGRRALARPGEDGSGGKPLVKRFLEQAPLPSSP